MTLRIRIKDLNKGIKTKEAPDDDVSLEELE